MVEDPSSTKVNTAFTKAALGYAAFNTRDPYYRNMAERVVARAKVAKQGGFHKVIDLGAGIGVSTRAIYDSLKVPGIPLELVAVEPEPDMCDIFYWNTLGNPDIILCQSRAEDMLGSVLTGVDAVFCCQALHVMNPPGKPEILKSILANVAKLLAKHGVFAFDLGPSNYKFAHKISDHRNGVSDEDAIVSELSHPLYQRVHQLVLSAAKKQYKFDRDNLWPPPAARMSFDQLQALCVDVGLDGLRVVEEFDEMRGSRVLEFIRNGWTIFFRWEPLSKLQTHDKYMLMNQAISQLYREPDFEDLLQEKAYHPTAIFTAIKR